MKASILEIRQAMLATYPSAPGQMQHRRDMADVQAILLAPACDLLLINGHQQIVPVTEPQLPRQVLRGGDRHHLPFRITDRLNASPLLISPDEKSCPVDRDPYIAIPSYRHSPYGSLAGSFDRQCCDAHRSIA